MKGALFPGGGTSHTECTGDTFACLSASRTSPQGYVSIYVSSYSRAAAYPSTSRSHRPGNPSPLKGDLEYGSFSMIMALTELEGEPETSV